MRADADLAINAEVVLFYRIVVSAQTALLPDQDRICPRPETSVKEITASARS
jgi:hypothetical protein